MVRKTPSAPFRDSAGKALEEYPHPSVAVDVALLTISSQGLSVLVHHAEDPVDRARRWTLPGGFVLAGERLHETVKRVLHDKCGIVLSRPPLQLRVFDKPDRDPRGWVMSVAHTSTVPSHELEAAMGGRSDLQLARVIPGESPVRLSLPDGQKSLPFDHDEIVDEAVRKIRSRYEKEPDPDRLLGDTFTLPKLRRVHEAVQGEEIHRDTFRRRMIPNLDQVEGWVDRGTVGPPAQVFRRKDDQPSSVQPHLWERAEYADEDLLAAVAAYDSTTMKPTVEGYRLWARKNPGKPSEALVRKRLSERYGGWYEILAASRDRAAARGRRRTGR